MIDLRSDTVTLPNDEMRRAAADAEVGDDVYGNDPTVNELEERAAEIVDTDAAMFVPSGTMGNQIAARVHTEHGQEALVEAESHVVRWELGGFADHSGLQLRTL
ncbi:MAG: threonine aldolase family protein, partial [Halanaeroarchaeum sp.]